MSKVGVFLVGEGSNEIGTYEGQKNYWNPNWSGVLGALLDKLAPDGWEVVGARKWAHLYDYKAVSSGKKDPRSPDTLCVLRAALDAKEADADLLVLTRDSDGLPEREAAIEAGYIQSSEKYAKVLKVAAGAAVPTIEGWILALKKERGTERLGKDQAIERLASTGMAKKDGKAMAAVVAAANLDELPADARSLNRWLTRAREALGAFA